MAKLFKKSKPDSSTISSKSKAQNHPIATNFLNSSSTYSETPKFGSFEKCYRKRVSNTMQMALSSESATSTNGFALTSASLPDISISTTNRNSSHLYPRSESEQYWTARALKAETLLISKEEHFEHLQSVTVEQETKRVTEVAQLTKLYDERLVKLERLLAILLGVLFLLTFFTFFSNLFLTHQGREARSAQNQWPHFTIPILSPFASVVEHEVSVVGSRTIFGSCLIIAGLAYFLLRHWINSNIRLRPAS
ncbi:hypothetical protein DFH05DRAFT_1485024 [Lentinula detonsa]|uniref:Transmembrane protein n=1 Tax=Lentinula detonsa TaxID=2804962 RepID=A0A9W8P439_9AGAR|nr:hypothetical protein DFH05DRAFT_1485024 [Lentinula detonsa]